MDFPTPLTIGTKAEEFLIRDDTKREGLFPLILVIIGALSILFGLLHWYEFYLLLKGQVTASMGIFLLGVAISILGLIATSQMKINKSQQILIDYNLWLTEKHGLVADDPLSEGRDTLTGNADFTDMNGNAVTYKVSVDFTNRLGGALMKPKNVSYFRISLLPAE